MKTENQVEAIRDIWDSLDDCVQVHQSNVLALLQEKLQGAITVIDGLGATTSDEPTMITTLRKTWDFKRLKYAVYAKKKLGKIDRDLNEWHRKFDPSWYLLARTHRNASIISNPSNPSKEILIIQELRNAHRMNDESIESRHSVFLTEYSIRMREPIPNTSAEMGYVSGKAVVIDSLRITKENDLQMATKVLRGIARILASIDPNIISLLACQGVVKVLDSSNRVTGFELIFMSPANLGKPRV